MEIRFRSLATKLRQIPTAEIDETVKLAGLQWDADTLPLRIMISSPLLSLKSEREALRDGLAPFADLDTQLFEKMPDSGLRNVRESMDLAHSCDLMIALFQPGYLGSKIATEELPEGYSDCLY